MLTVKNDVGFCCLVAVGTGGSWVLFVIFSQVADLYAVFAAEFFTKNYTAKTAYK